MSEKRNLIPFRDISLAKISLIIAAFTLFSARTAFSLLQGYPAGPGGKTH